MRRCTCEYRPRGLLSRRRVRLLSWILVIAVLSMANGCGLFRRSSPKMMTFVIKSENETNDGQPFYVLIRYVNQQTFLTDSYQSISTTVFAPELEPGLLTVRVVLPGKKLKLEVPKLDKDSIGVYCMFTEPGEGWKILLSQPLKSKYKIRLEKNSIRRK